MPELSSVKSLISHTPPWVWAILVYLLVVGMQALKPRMVSVNRLIFLPLILLGLKYKIFLSPDVWIYLVGVATGLAAGYFIAQRSVVMVFKNTKSVQIPGSSSLIVVLLGIFIMNYYFAYLKAVSPAEYLKLLTTELALSGLLAGYFSGQRASYIRKYFQS